MNGMELVYSAVQQEADAAKDFGRRGLVRILVLTIGIGLLLTVVGVAL